MENPIETDLQPKSDKIDAEVKSDIEAEAKDSSGKTETKSEAKQKMKEFLQKHYGKLLFGLTALAMASAALALFLQNDGKPSEIERIYRDDKTGYIAIKYKTYLPWRINDTVELVDTDSNPKFDGTFKLKKILENNTIWIDRTLKKSEFKKEGTKTTIILRTSFNSQLAGIVSDTAKTAVATTVTIASAAAAPVIDTGKDLAKSLFKELFGDIGETATIIIYIVIGLIILGVVYKLYTMFKSDPAPTIIQVPTTVANRLFKSLRKSGAKLRF